jgi:hypothetical protein
MRWRLFLEDYGVQFHYIKGETNSLADALSRLPFHERQNTMETCKVVALDSFFSMMIDDDDLLDCFVNLPNIKNVPFVLNYQTNADAQRNDFILTTKAAHVCSTNSGI